MGKCKSCGRSGLFFKVGKNGLCKECNERENLNQIKTEFSQNQMRREQAASIADQQIVRLNNAQKKFAEDKNYEELIKEYELVFSEENDWNTFSHKLKLADYYQKVGRNNDAWGLLNRLSMEYPDEIARVRKAQYRQLKAEKNYPESLKMLFLYEFDDFKSYTSWDDSHIADFISDAVKIGKKIKISESDIDELGKILSECVKDKRADETVASERFKDWYQKVQSS